jgi:hypothetical protein
MFDWVERNDVEYGWAARKIEGHGPTRRTLPPWTANYISKCQVWPSALMDEPLGKCFNFYNNFHVGKVSFFQRPDVLHYLRAVNGSGGVDMHRWGDSTIQAYAVRLFMDPAKIRMIPDGNAVPCVVKRRNALAPRHPSDTSQTSSTHCCTCYMLNQFPSCTRAMV